MFDIGDVLDNVLIVESDTVWTMDMQSRVSEWKRHRPVMRSLHQTVTARWGADSMWQAVMECWRLQSCQGRVAEYELYWNYATSSFRSGCWRCRRP